MTPPAIVLRDVSKRFGTVASLDRLTLSIQPHSVFGYLGPNGAGKTTTLRVLLGLVRPDAGEVSVLGMDPRVDGERVRAAVGALLETDGLYDRLTAWQNLEYHARIRHMDAATRASRIDEVLRACDLFDRRDERIAAFSKGMRQKLAVARALLHRPPLLLLDEPFAGLDPVAATELRGRIVDLAHEHGTTVLLTTHDLAHVEKACDRVAVLQGGRVLAEGTIDELRSPRADLEVSVCGVGLGTAVLEAMQRDGAILSFALAAEPAAVPRAVLKCTRDQRPHLGVRLVQSGVVLEELATVRASLEDTFLALMAKPEHAS